MTRKRVQLRGIGLLIAALLMLGPAAAQASPILATSYDMLNGGDAADPYTYHDDTYAPDPTGQRFINYAPLAGGKGDLTDGVIATEHWVSTPELYVGWQLRNPTITFHFAEAVNIDTVKVSLDGNGAFGQVNFPISLDITMGSTTINFPITDAAGPSTFTYSALGLSGNQLDLTLYCDTEWIMLSEVQFDGTSVPLPGTITLLAPALLGLAAYSWKRKA